MLTYENGRPMFVEYDQNGNSFEFDPAEPVSDDIAEKIYALPVSQRNRIVYEAEVLGFVLESATGNYPIRIGAVPEKESNPSCSFVKVIRRKMPDVPLACGYNKNDNTFSAVTADERLYVTFALDKPQTTDASSLIENMSPEDVIALKKAYAFVNKGADIPYEKIILDGYEEAALRLGVDTNSSPYVSTEKIKKYLKQNGQASAD